MRSSRSWAGIALTVVGGLVMILAGLWYLEVISPPVPANPGMLVSGVGIVLVGTGAYFLVQADEE